MKNILLLLAIITLSNLNAYSQNTRFATQGIIEYEKKVNVYAVMAERIKRYPDDTFGPKILEDYKKNNPQFKILKSTLAFGKDQTLFTPVADDKPTSNWYSTGSTEQNNTIYTNTAARTSIAQKKIYEDVYLVKDSTRKINWKITDEFRNIAGYDCRRANAIIMDSVYVVAFYTDEIPVSGGPESFSGLPGMILGVALPREHVTWFATSVTDQPITDDRLKAPVKGKATDNKKLLDMLKEALKDWGNGAQDVLRNAML